MGFPLLDRSSRAAATCSWISSAVDRTSDDRRVPADSDRAYEALLAEVDELRRENARLRGLLGLDSRGEDGHTVSWSPTLLTDPSGAAPGRFVVAVVGQGRAAVVAVWRPVRCVRGSLGECVEREVRLAASDEEPLVKGASRHATTCR